MAPTNKVIIIEDETAIAQLLKIHLSGVGFEVDLFSDAESAFVVLQKKQYELCLLDWMLPGIQGIDFLKKIRPQQKMMKIMMITAKVDPDSIVQGLEAGADDYLPKPFEAKVLLARVRNLIRRFHFESQLVEEAKQQGIVENSSHQISLNFPDQMTVDEMTIHFKKYFVRYKENDIHLTPSEFKLMASLFKAQGQVLTREQLIDQIQGEDVSVTGRTIDTHIFALRKKMGDWATHIETIRGVGYRILISAEDASEPQGL